MENGHKWIAYSRVTPPQAIELRHHKLDPILKFEIRCRICERHFNLKAIQEACPRLLRNLLALGLFNPLKLAALIAAGLRVTLTLGFAYFNYHDPWGLDSGLALLTQIPLLEMLIP